MGNPLLNRQPTSTNPVGVYVGTVSRAAAGDVRVEVPHLASGFEWPAVHGIDVTPDVGWSVAVAFLNDTDEELIILLRLA